MNFCTTSTSKLYRRIARHGLDGNVGDQRRHDVMHMLLILVLLCLVFPVFARLLGWMLSAVFWLILVVVVLGLIGALSH